MSIDKSIHRRYKILWQRIYTEINIALCAIHAFIILSFQMVCSLFDFITCQTRKVYHKDKVKI